ncbi:MAG: type II secretion system protein [Methylophilaceae bacterium]
MVFPIDNGKTAGNKTSRAFTLIELMVVMAIVATLLSVVVPRYFEGLKRSKETVLKEDLKEMRNAIDHYFEDKNTYPASLETLVTERYIKFIPEDPVTDSKESWQTVMPPDNSNKVYDIRSGSTETSSDGTTYNSW